MTNTITRHAMCAAQAAVWGLDQYHHQHIEALHDKEEDAEKDAEETENDAEETESESE